MKAKGFSLVVALVCLFVLDSAAFGQKIVLKTEPQDIQPHFIKNADGSIGGMAIDLMKLIEKNSNYQFVYGTEFAPGPRAMKNIEDGVIDFRIGLGKTPEREKVMVFGEAACEVKDVVFARADDTSNPKSLADLKAMGKDGTVLTLAGATMVGILQNAGVIVDSGVQTVDENLAKMLSKRANYMAYTDISMYYILAQDKYKGKFKALPIVLSQREQFVVYSSKLAPATVTGLNEVIKKLKKSGEWDKVIDKYFK